MSPVRLQLRLTGSRIGLMGYGVAVGALLISGTIMAQECRFTTPLTLKDTQGGVVGETGTVWTIAPDCSFTVARQIGSKLLEPHRRGRLTSEQEARLKAMLAQIDDSHFSTPAEPAPRVNPHRISLSYAGRQAVLTLPAGAKHAKPVVELAAAVRDMLGR